MPIEASAAAAIPCIFPAFGRRRAARDANKQVSVAVSQTCPSTSLQFRVPASRHGKGYGSCSNIARRESKRIDGRREGGREREAVEKGRRKGEHRFSTVAFPSCGVAEIPCRDRYRDRFARVRAEQTYDGREGRGGRGSVIPRHARLVFPCD